MTSDCDRFLQFHDNLRRSGKFYVFDHGSEDYRLYITAVAGRPQAVESVFRYCLQTDDVELARRLFNHLGAEYIFAHFSNLYDPTQVEILGDVKPLFWCVALCGSIQIFKLLAQARLATLIEAQLQKEWPPKSDPQLSHSVMSDEEYTRLQQACIPSLRAILCQTTHKLQSSPILIAASKNHGHIVSELLQYGVDPNSTDRHGSTPAILAASFNCVSVLSELAQCHTTDFNKADTKGFTPVLVACQRGHLDTLQFLADLARVDFKLSNSAGLGCTAIAAMYNHPHLIPFLASIQTSTGVDVNLPLTQLNTANLNTQVLPLDTPFLIAARNNHPAIIREFLTLSNKADIVTKRDKDGMTALHIAAKNDFPQVIQEIIQLINRELLNLIINTEDNTGKTPLYYASLKGFIDIVALLAPLSDCSYSCRISDSDVRVQPSLLAAAANGHADIVDLLLLQNDNLINQTDSRGHTAVSVAAKLGHLNVVEILVQHGADLNIRSNKGGGTPLQKARKYKQEHVVKFLIDHT